MSGRRRAGSTLSSTLLMDRELSQGSLFSATSTSFFKKNPLNQCLNLSLVSEFDKEIGLDYLRAMRLSDSKTDCNSKIDYHQNIGLYVLPTIMD